MCHAFTISQSMKSTMIRLLAAVLSPKNPFFHSQIDWRTSSRTENNLQYFYRPVSTYRYHPPNTFRSGRAQPLKRECLGFLENLRGARARRTRRQNWADCAPPPEEHPPDECAEFCLTASSISRRSGISYRPPDLASDRERGRCSVIKVYLVYTCNACN